jgi:hypothetical protein
MQYSAMSLQFESEKNRRAFIFTAIICGVLLLLFLIPWPKFTVKEPAAQELLEINLGNDSEGWGETQPLIKGEMSEQDNQPAEEKQQQAAPTNEETARDITDDNEKDEEAAPVTKPVNPEPKATKVIDKPVATATRPTPTPAVVPAPAPQKPKLPLYKGTTGNGNGNGATEDNGYRYQGNKPGGTGDAGSPNGKPDSYGTKPGGNSGGGPRVSGDRKIVRYYAFTGDLEKATIYAIVKVSPDGVGTFAGFGKNSTARSAAYAENIRNYLRNVQFDKADHESTVTVQFNFTVK